MIKLELLSVCRNDLHGLRYGGCHDIVSIGDKIAGNRLLQIFTCRLPQLQRKNNIFLSHEIFPAATHILRRLPHGNFQHFLICHSLPPVFMDTPDQIRYDINSLYLFFSHAKVRVTAENDISANKCVLQQKVALQQINSRDG